MATRTKATIGDIRKWALKQSEFKKIVGTRGRLPSAVIEAWNDEHPDDQYINDAAAPVNVTGLVEQAEDFLRAGMALVKINELIEEMEDPDRDFWYPNVARRLRTVINEGMTAAKS